MRKTKTSTIIFSITLLFSSAAYAQEPSVKIGGFIDTYFAFDSNMPDNFEREFTTQPVRHNEFNINMAFIDAILKQEKTRGRLALQNGNSVTKNYASEATQGETSGPEDSKYLQEAFVGTKLGEKTWIDMGIFLGNIGLESWISKENWTYTRSLILDYVPYYSSGLRLEHYINEKQIFQIQLLNGWQTISETNRGKAIGMQYKHILTDSTVLGYNNFLGDEKVVPNQQTGKFNSRFRGYHNFYLVHTLSDKWKFSTSFDVGHQSQQNNEGVDPWIGTNLIVRRTLNEKQALTFRVEYYNDRHQSNVVTGTDDGFQVVGASVNFDQKLEENALWRTEIRGFHSKDKIYPQNLLNKSRIDSFIVTSLALWF